MLDAPLLPGPGDRDSTHDRVQADLDAHLPQLDREASDRIALDSLGRLGPLLRVLGFVPWHVPRLCVPFAVALVRVLRVLALGQFNASAFEAVSFSLVVGNYFVPLCALAVLLHPAAGNWITHHIRTSRFLVVASSGGDSQAAKLAIAQHRQRLRQHGDRLATACYVVSFVFVLMLNEPRVVALLDSSVEGDHDAFPNRVDVELAGAMGDWGYVMLLVVTDVVVIVAVVMALCTALWLFSTATHDLTHLTTAHDSTASDVDDILEGREVQPRARFMLDDSALADPVGVDLLVDVHDERDLHLQVCSSLLQEKLTAMVLLEEIEFQSQLLARLQSRNAFVAKVVLVTAVTGLGLTGQFVVVDAVSSIVSRKPKSNMILSLFALAVSFCMAAFCVGFGARFMRRSRALQTTLKRTKADLLDPEQRNVADILAQSSQSDTMTMVSMLEPFKLSDASGSFWKLLRSVYGRVLFHTAYITVIAIGFVALLAAVRMPSCSHVEVKRSSPIAAFLTTDCSDAQNAQSFAAAGFINAFVSVMSPVFMFMTISNASVREYGDILPVSLILSAAAAIITFVIGLERHERFARVPPLVFGLLNIVFVCYRAAFPGQAVSRPAVPVRAAITFGSIVLWLLFQVILIGGLLVTRFVLVSKSDKLFIAVILFPIISFFFRHVLGYLCSQYDQHVDGDARKAVALHSFGHMYLSLVSRMLVAALASLRDQVLTVAVWMLFEIGTRTVGPLLHGCVWFLVLPEGPARQAKLENAEQERTNTTTLRRIYAHMLSELVSIPTAVATVLLMRELLSSGIDSAFKSEWASSHSLLGSLAVQLLFEVITDVLSILSEELVLECDCLALWRRHDVRHALASLLAVIACVAASLEEFSVLMGNFVRK